MAIAEFDCGVPIRLQQCVLDGSYESQGSPVECGSLLDPWVPRGLGALKRARAFGASGLGFTC